MQYGFVWNADEGRRNVIVALCMLAVVALASVARAGTPLTGPAGELYRKARSGRFFADAAKLAPDVRPTSDGRSFLVVWKGTGSAKAPERWIVSLPGSRGFATDDLALWHRHLEGRDVGLVSLQWWLGGGDDTTSYYGPEQIYREIDLALQLLRAQPGKVMLHGFSRGSANSYAVAAIDAGIGKGYFGLNVASSGGVGLDYPPTRAIGAGAYGARPLAGTRWITVAGGRDPEPERDGIPGMRRAAAWLEEQGARVVERIEDPESGHGALQRNPRNASRVLDRFLGGSDD